MSRVRSDLHRALAVSGFPDFQFFGFRILGFLGLFDLSDFFGLSNDCRTSVR